MAEEEEENTFEPTQKEQKEIKQTKFQSPVPFLLQLRNLIFGKKIPDIFTRVTFYMNMVIWASFMVWNVVGYFAISARQLILQQKGISVERIIGKRGAALGYERQEFIDRLITYHAISVICWLVVLVGLILLYRKVSKYIYVVLSPIIFYIGMMIFYIGFTFFKEDITSIDKIMLLIMIVSVSVHAFMMNNKDTGGSFNFFGVDEGDR